MAKEKVFQAEAIALGSLAPIINFAPAKITMKRATTMMRAGTGSSKFAIRHCKPLTVATSPEATQSPVQGAA